MTAYLSDFEKIAVGKEVESFEVSPQFDAYSGVVIVDSDGNEELVGTDTGRTITIPGRGGSKRVMMADRASVPPVEAPIAMRSIGPVLAEGMIMGSLGAGTGFSGV